jgi:hypothetical protein
LTPNARKSFSPNRGLVIALLRMNKTLESDGKPSDSAGASSSTPNKPTPYSALAKGRFYLFFILLPEIFVAILCGIDKI